jgi:hypothetical protein
MPGIDTCSLSVNMYSGKHGIWKAPNNMRAKLQLQTTWTHTRPKREHNLRQHVIIAYIGSPQRIWLV